MDNAIVLMTILTHLLYRECMLKKRDISNINSQFRKRKENRALADVLYLKKMTSLMAQDGVMVCVLLKDITNTCKCIRHISTIDGNYSAQWQKVGRS